MSVTGKLFGIWAVSKTVSSATPLFMRLLVGMAAITVGAVVAAILIAMLMVGAVWLTYMQLTAHGVDPQTAGIIIGGILLAMLGAMALAAKRYCQRLYAIFKKTLPRPAPFTGRLSRAAEAFMEGFHNDSPSR